jgi:hypothetical protein
MSNASINNNRNVTKAVIHHFAHGADVASTTLKEGSVGLGAAATLITGLTGVAVVFISAAGVHFNTVATSAFSAGATVAVGIIGTAFTSAAVAGVARDISAGAKEFADSISPSLAKKFNQAGAALALTAAFAVGGVVWYKAYDVMKGKEEIAQAQAKKCTLTQIFPTTPTATNDNKTAATDVRVYTLPKDCPAP